MQIGDFITRNNCDLQLNMNSKSLTDNEFIPKNRNYPILEKNETHIKIRSYSIDFWFSLDENDLQYWNKYFDLVQNN